MAGKSKKHRAPNPISVAAEAKPPMVSLQMKKTKKTSSGK